jgi:thiamine-phosphate pyrophosphorylase
MSLTRTGLYLITSNETSRSTEVDSPEFRRVIQIVRSAVEAEIPLLQIREKSLSAKNLYNLVKEAAAITNRTGTRLLVNDRADIAVSAGADGVHLTAHSLNPSVIRSRFGKKLLIGSSTHTLEEAVEARQSGADFLVFGPVFQTPSKDSFGPPVGLDSLLRVVESVDPFPVLAIGGISIDRVKEVMRSGAKGVAAIRMLNDPVNLSKIAMEIRRC